MQTSKPFILFFSPVRHAKAAFEELQEVARVELVTSTNRQEFFKDVLDKYKDVQVIYRTSASGVVSLPILMRFYSHINMLQVAGNFDVEFIQHLPPSCKFICHNGAGEFISSFVAEIILIAAFQAMTKLMSRPAPIEESPSHTRLTRSPMPQPTWLSGYYSAH